VNTVLYWEDVKCRVCCWAVQCILLRECRSLWKYVWYMACDRWCDGDC